MDFRAVQGAITVDGAANLLSGLAGTTLNAATTVGASVTGLTGVGARSVGVAAGRRDRHSRSAPTSVCGSPW